MVLEKLQSFACRRYCLRLLSLDKRICQPVSKKYHSTMQISLTGSVSKQIKACIAYTKATPLMCLRFEKLLPFCVRYCSTTENCVVPVFLRAENFSQRTAIVSQHGKYSYSDLLYYSTTLAQKIQSAVAAGKVKLNRNTAGLSSSGNQMGVFSLNGQRVSFLCDNDMSYIITQWAVWLLGGVVVPLCKSHPVSELEYFVWDSDSCLLIGTENYVDKLKPVSVTLGVPLMVLSRDDYGGAYTHRESPWGDKIGQETLKAYVSQDGYQHKNAMIIYTSGTTGRPKGVVHTHGSINAQMLAMIDVWGWSSDDTILHVLPLHHVHGVVNVLMTSLYCGATCVMLDQFNPIQVWKALLEEDMDPAVNLFMAVPTVYARMLEEFDRQVEGGASYIPANIKDILQKKIRLMVSGSAALPQPIMEKWEDLTGHTLLERYGMTEIGMALTNPLHGRRTPGAVGKPFPGVSVRIVCHHDTNTGYDVITEADCRYTTVTPGKEGESGELLVKGDNVFKEYWNRPEATEDTFTNDGWFKTGDTAVYKNGTFRIVGRTSVDVIKSGGYKISALDIERHLLAHPCIRDVAVIGLPDETWGQTLAVVLVLREGHSLTLSDLQAWSADKMPSYHIPHILKVLMEMPRNAMGKINKKELAKDIFPEYFQ